MASKLKKVSSTDDLIGRGGLPATSLPSGYQRKDKPWYEQGAPNHRPRVKKAKRG